jgi:hypothetical protein
MWISADLRVSMKSSSSRMWDCGQACGVQCLTSLGVNAFKNMLCNVSCLLTWHDKTSRGMTFFCSTCLPTWRCPRAATTGHGTSGRHTR